MFYFR